MWKNKNVKRIVFGVFVLFIFFSMLLCSGITDSEPGYYVASSESDVFHKPNCRYVKQIKSENKITFNSKQDAINAGYRACKVCQP